MKSNQLVLASVLCGATAIALAASPCGWPITPAFDPGGQCINGVAGPFCTQPRVISDGGCFGQDNHVRCREFTATRESDYFILRAPASGCNVTNPCVPHPPQVTVVTYRYGSETLIACPIGPIDPDKP